jgi:hypothetical protein
LSRRRRTRRVEGRMRAISLSSTTLRDGFHFGPSLRPKARSKDPATFVEHVGHNGVIVAGEKSVVASVHLALFCPRVSSTHSIWALILFRQSPPRSGHAVHTMHQNGRSN